MFCNGLFPTNANRIYLKLLINIRGGFAVYLYNIYICLICFFLSLIVYQIQFYYSAVFFLRIIILIYHGRLLAHLVRSSRFTYVKSVYCTTKPKYISCIISLHKTKLFPVIYLFSIEFLYNYKYL